MQRGLFFLAFAFLMGHELDAMTHAEWRLLPLLSSLPDDHGRVAFVAIHVPLAFALLWLDARGGWIFHAIFGGFCAAHVCLHWAFAAHPLYAFHAAFSEILICGAGISGAALAAVAVIDRARA